VLSYAFYSAIADNDFNIMLISWTVLLGVLVLKSSFLAIAIILFISFFGNWLEGLGLIPPQINWLVEVLIFLLFLKAFSTKIFRKEKLNLTGMSIVFLFLIICFFSYLINSVSYFHTLFFLRLVFRYYLLFLAVINLDFDEKSMKLLNKILIFLFFIQIPTAVIKWLIFGQGETAIGTYDIHGGGLSTVIPLIAVNFLLAYYFFYKASKSYILAAICFVAFGLIGGKRAILLFVPIVVIFLGWFMRDRTKNFLRYILIGCLLILLTGYASIKLIPSLNPQKTRGGEVDFNYLASYFADYSMRTHRGSSAGRIATSINVFRILKNTGLENILVGLGPGSYIETRFRGLRTTLKERGELPIMYGTTGLSWLALQAGYLGVLIYFLLFVLILTAASQYYKSEPKGYWKSFGLGMVGFSFIMLWISIAYWAVYTGDLIPMVYFLLAAFLVKRRNNNKKEMNSSMNREVPSSFYENKAKLKP
jgi:hypothetical protein